MCGKNYSMDNQAQKKQGSPPRVREKLFLLLPLGFGLGITPACAGKTSASQPFQERSRDHPRVCGKNVVSEGLIICRPGSPPRVREKRTKWVESKLNARITPACAGKTLYVTNPTSSTWDHPRVCGKNDNSSIESKLKSGSPPRVREKLVLLWSY